MSTSIEQRLKSQMDRVQVRLRPDLAREAYRAHRRHVLRSRSAAVVTTAIVIAAGATVAASDRVPFGAAPRVPRPTSPADQSGAFLPPAGMLPPAPGDDLTAQQATQDIFWQHITTQTIPATNTAVSNLFQYGSASRLTLYHPDGTPQEDNVFTPVGATLVSYDTRAWVRHEVPDSATPATAQAPSAPSLSARQLCLTAQQMGLGAVGFAAQPDAARSLLACTGVVVTHGQRIEGIDAIKLADARHGETLWVNAVTYLPVQLTDVFPVGEPVRERTGATTGPADYTSVGETIQYGFLPPTAANLPYLSAPLPPGFTGTTEHSTFHSQDLGTVTASLAP